MTNKSIDGVYKTGAGSVYQIHNGVITPNLRANLHRKFGDEYRATASDLAGTATLLTPQEAIEEIGRYFRYFDGDIAELVYADGQYNFQLAVNETGDFEVGDFLMPNRHGRPIYYMLDGLTAVSDDEIADLLSAKQKSAAEEKAASTTTIAYQIYLRETFTSIDGWEVEVNTVLATYFDEEKAEQKLSELTENAYLEAILING